MPAGGAYGNRFYEASFGVDELGTAATLLGWRDLWHLHVWGGSASVGEWL